MTTPTDLGPLLDALTDCAGAFSDGYTSEQVDATLGSIRRACGLRIVAVWQYVDLCTGGDSNLAVVGEDGALTDVSAGLQNHLNGETDPGVLAAAVRAEGLEALRSTSTWSTDITGKGNAGELVEVTYHNLAGVRRG